MKIQILKDIPGYKAGQVLEGASNGEVNQKYFNDGFAYDGNFLVSNGWAKEIKPEIDIEELRKDRWYPDCKYTSDWTLNMCVDKKESSFFSAYRIVKTVIEKVDNENYLGDPKTYEIALANVNEFVARNRARKMYSFTFLPKCTLAAAEKVIELCKPELEILFNLK